MENAILINEKDNVVTAIKALPKGTEGYYRNRDGNMISINIINDIPIYHKFAIADINKDAPIVKYGEYIAIASMDIKAGSHVHVHNITNHKD